MKKLILTSSLLLANISVFSQQRPPYVSAPYVNSLSNRVFIDWSGHPRPFPSPSTVPSKTSVAIFPAQGNQLAVSLGAFWHLDETPAASMTMHDATPTGEDLVASGTIAVPGTFSGIQGNGTFLNAGNVGQGYYHNDDAIVGQGSGKSFTVAGWFRIDDNQYADTDAAALISKWRNTFDGGTSANQDYLLANKNSNFRWSVRNLAGTRVDLTSSTTWTFNTWYHVAAGYDDTAQQIWIQVNGGTRDTTACVGVQRTGVGFAIGNFTSTTLPGTGGALTRGDWDECGLWNRSLSSWEVTQIASPWIYPFTTSVGTQIATNWSWIVVNKNSGAAPANSTVTALAAYIDNQIANTNWISKKLFCFFAPDNLIACTTPVVARYPYYASYEQSTAAFYSSPFINHNFVGGDVSANGLTGNTTTKYLEPGFSLNATKAITSAQAVTFVRYIYQDSNSSGGIDEGELDASANGVNFVVTYSDNHMYMRSGGPNNLIGGASGISPSPGNGFYLDTRVSSTIHRGYFANSSTAWAQIGSDDTTAFSSVFINAGVTLFAQRFNGAVGTWSPSTMSYWELTDNSVTSAQGQVTYNGVQALRTALGGGFR